MAPSRRAAAAFAAALYAFALPAAFAGGGMPVAADLHDAMRADGADARVLVLMVSRSDCGYCKVLKREVLDPTVKSGDYAGRAVFRELMIDDPAPIRDLDGTQTTAAAVARRYREYLSPTLLFLDADGAELSKRRRGVTTIEYYGHYLDRAIRRAEAALAARGS